MEAPSAFKVYLVRKASKSAERQPRADAVRNREKLLLAAKDVFAREGAAASLEQVAREASVGIGTLYRHYPTRDALIEAVYRQETDTLSDAASRLLSTCAPRSAMREWLLLFVGFLETKRDIVDALETLIGGPEQLYSGTPALLSSPIERLVAAVNATGGRRIDIPPLDILRAIVGIATIRPSAEWKGTVTSLTDLLLATEQQCPAVETPALTK